MPAVNIPSSAYVKPPAGADPGLAAITAGIGAIGAGLGPQLGKWGGLVSGLAQIPGAFLNAQSAQATADVQNQRISDALTALTDNANKAYVRRPPEWNQALNAFKQRGYAAYNAQQQGMADEGQRQVSDAIARSAAYGVPDTQIAKSLDEMSRRETTNRVNQGLSLVDNLRQQYTNLQLGIGQAEQQRASYNESVRDSLLKATVSVLTQVPLNFVSSEGMMNAVNGAIQASNEFQFQREQLRLQEKQIDRQFLGGLIGGGLSFAGDVTGAGILANAYKAPASVAQSSGFVPTIQNFPRPF